MTGPGWFPDPEQPGWQRYWNGQIWTDNRAPLKPLRSTAKTAAIVIGWVLVAFAVLLVLHETFG